MNQKRTELQGIDGDKYLEIIRGNIQTGQVAGDRLISSKSFHTLPHLTSRSPDCCNNKNKHVWVCVCIYIYTCLYTYIPVSESSSCWMSLWTRRWHQACFLMFASSDSVPCSFFLVDALYPHCSLCSESTNSPPTFWPFFFWRESSFLKSQQQILL